MKKQKLFAFWLNTAFINQSGITLLDKQMLDHACSDKTQKTFSKNFQVEIFTQAHIPLFDEIISKIQNPALLQQQFKSQKKTLINQLTQPFSVQSWTLTYDDSEAILDAESRPYEIGYEPLNMPEDEIEQIRTFYQISKDKFYKPPKNFFSLSIKDLYGRKLKFTNFKGKKAILCVNVATQSETSLDHYQGLMELYDLYHSQGLEILGFPCNQFGNQESGSNEEIRSVIKQQLKCKFPIFTKIYCNGPETHNVYKFLRTQSELYNKTTGYSKGIPWNFSKFLINENGAIEKFYEPSYLLTSIVTDIKKLLML